MSAPVGITIPKLLPITGTFALPLSVYFAWLSVQVSLARVNANVLIGDKSSSTTEPTKDPLTIASRCHANFAETVPLALLLGGVVEMNGGNRKILTGSYAALMLFRILHAEFGLKGPEAKSIGRPVGSLGTLGFIVGMSGYAAYLVKGYWGF